MSECVVIEDFLDQSVHLEEREFEEEMESKVTQDIQDLVVHRDHL